MEIQTEFTNYCHQEFNDEDEEQVAKNLAGSGRSRHRSGKGDEDEDNAPPSSPGSDEERVVPIRLANGEKFIPKFTRLDDLDPPEWSSFSPKKRVGKSNGENEVRHEETLKERQQHEKQECNNVESKAGAAGDCGVGSPFRMKETLVPIRVVEEQEQHRTSSKREKEELNSREKRLFDEEGEEKTIFTEKSERREKEDREDQTSTRRTTRTTTDKTTKSMQEKKVQHTVRFNVDEAKHGESRSSSLDSKNRMPMQSNLKPARVRHKSGGGIPSKPVVAGDPNTEKALHEIDRDINKIWRELQQLDTMRPTVPPPAPPPSRGATAMHRSSPTPATPVKIRTYTTPTPQASPFVKSTPPPSPKVHQDRQQQVDRSSSSSTPPPPLSRVTPPPSWAKMPSSPSPLATNAMWGTPTRATVASASPTPPTVIASPPPPSSSSTGITYHALPPSPWSRGGSRSTTATNFSSSYTPRRDMEPTRPGTIHPLRPPPLSSSPTPAGSRSPPPPPPSSSSTTTAPTGHYHQYHHPASSSPPPPPAGSSLRAISPSSANGPFGANGTVLASVTTHQKQNGGAPNGTAHPPQSGEYNQILPRSKQQTPTSSTSGGGAKAAEATASFSSRLDGRDASIPFADEDSKAVADGARSSLREPRPLSRLVDQGTQTEVSEENLAKNGKEAGKCAVQ